MALRTAARTAPREGTAMPAARHSAPSEVATSPRSGGTDAAPTLRPRPSTTAVPCPAPPRSAVGGSPIASIPATLRPPMRTSFGHLSRAATPSPARASATPTARARTARVGGTLAGRRTTREARIEAPGASSHTRPCRPRPALWWSAATTRPLSQPAAAASRAVRIVESVSRRKTTRRPSVCVVRAASRPARSGGRASPVRSALTVRGRRRGCRGGGRGRGGRRRASGGGSRVRSRRAG